MMTGLTAAYPSGKGAVCKTAMQRFEPARRLQLFLNSILDTPINHPIRSQLIIIGSKARDGFCKTAMQRFEPATVLIVSTSCSVSILAPFLLFVIIRHA